MIPVKIISFDEAKRIGLTNDKTGFGIAGAGFVGKKESNGKITPHEKTIIRNNGEMELVFMDKERMQDLKGRRRFSAYLKQFDKIPKEVK